MAILIGTDEAGYGPNLGPLIISATAWQVPDSLSGADLFDVLDRTVSREAAPQSMAIADSKALYQPGGGLAALERGVLGALLVSGVDVCSWRDAWRRLAPDAVRYLDEVPWYAGFDAQLPCDIERGEIESVGQKFAGGLRDFGVRLLGIYSVAIFPGRFNSLVEVHGSKGAALTAETLRLVEQLLGSFRDRHLLIRCDKHGGRNRYGRLLQTQFPEYLVEVVQEARSQSIYRWGPPARRVEMRFVAQCETFLPTALASMTSKYLRELAMQAFNAFWRAQLPNLRPTAGYPVDSRRFKREIQAAQADLGIDDWILWRKK